MWEYTNNGPVPIRRKVNIRLQSAWEERALDEPESVGDDHKKGAAEDDPPGNHRALPTDQGQQRRHGQNVICDSVSGTIVYLPPEAQDVPALMSTLVAWINAELERDELPVPLVAALAHYQFATVHPHTTARDAPPAS